MEREVSMTAYKDKGVIIIFDRDSIIEMESLLRAIFDLYEDSRKILYELSIKATPPASDLIERLLLTNAIELRIIKEQWRKFFKERFEKTTEQ